MSVNININNVCKEEIFSKIFSGFSDDLYKFLYYKYGGDNNPEDIVQSAFEKLWKNCKDVMPHKAKSFLFTVANNEMLNWISRKKTALNYTLQQDDEHNMETPQYYVEEKEYHDRIQRALNDLTEDQRVTFMLNRVEGKKHREIADLLGISQKAVEKRIYTTLKILREKLDTDKF